MIRTSAKMGLRNRKRKLRKADSETSFCPVAESTLIEQPIEHNYISDESESLYLRNLVAGPSDIQGQTPGDKDHSPG